MKLTFFFLLAVTLCSAYTTAQRDDQIPVPVKWVMDNTNKVVGVFPQTPDKKFALKQDMVLEAGSYGPCVLEWKSNKPKRGIYIYVPLRDMNTQRIAIAESDKTANDGTGFWHRQAIWDRQEKGGRMASDKGISYSNEIRIVFADKNTAERFSRALRDGITQCGGKPETPEPY